MYLEPTELGSGLWNGKTLFDRVMGKFYTPPEIGIPLAAEILKGADSFQNEISVVDPFAGDGRLVYWLLEEANKLGIRRKKWIISLWDLDGKALRLAKENILQLCKKLDQNVEINCKKVDSFSEYLKSKLQFNICVTNPPWELLKPDSRETRSLSKKQKLNYIDNLRTRDRYLSSYFQLSVPKRRFSGWGINLARCGSELALKLVADEGVCGIVSPSSLMGDDQSDNLRKWIFNEYNVKTISHFVAESRLFKKVDQPCITFVAQRSRHSSDSPRLIFYDKKLVNETFDFQEEDWQYVQKHSFKIPLNVNPQLIHLFRRWEHLPTFSQLENEMPEGLWAGRELDETGHQRFLTQKGMHLFVKGRMIRRFGFLELPQLYVKLGQSAIPASVRFHRIAWRDVARPNQRRRIQASIIPPKMITGNSLGVAHFRDNDTYKLHLLLAIMNSFVFEIQLRMHLSTGHVSLSSVRHVKIPHLERTKEGDRIVALTKKILAGENRLEDQLEVAVAQLYCLSRSEFKVILDSFKKITEDEKKELLVKSPWES